MYRLYRYVPRDRIWLLRFSVVPLQYVRGLVLSRVTKFYQLNLKHASDKGSEKDKNF